MTGVRAEAPLPANGTLSLGYGSGGGLAYEFVLRKNQERDVGFIKLFSGSWQDPSFALSLSFILCLGAQRQDINLENIIFTIGADVASVTVLL